MSWYDIIFLLVILVVWVVLFAKILPRFGVGT